MTNPNQSVLSPQDCLVALMIAVSASVNTFAVMVFAIWSPTTMVLVVDPSCPLVIKKVSVETPVTLIISAFVDNA